ncbi:MAG: patatin-like phospholipase family protein [Candidatus Omnitrophota bacterium]|jgi:NTE family protein
MDSKEVKFLIANTAPFNKLKEEEVDGFLNICEIKTYKRGEIIYNDQDPPDYFYFLLKGRIVILGSDSGIKAEIELIKRGTAFGIISLFNDEPHSVTTKPIEESLTLRVEKEKFKNFLSLHPALSAEFYRILSQRIRARSGKKKIFQCKRIAIFGTRLSGKTTYAFNLAFKLKEETRKNVIFVEFIAEEDKKPLSFCEQEGKMFDLGDYKEENFSNYCLQRSLKEFKDLSIDCLAVKMTGSENFSALINFLSENYHFVIYDIPDSFEKDKFYELLSPADYFHYSFLPAREDADKASLLIGELKAKNSINIEKIKVILSDFSGQTRLSSAEIKEIIGHSVYATLTSMESQDYGKTLRRISREIGELLVGLALGSGGAYGFSHIGVLKILQQNNIPVDIICGSSIGAVIAALWALGYDADKIEELTSSFGKKLNLFSFRGFSFPFRGFWKAKYLENVLKRLFKEKTFYDIKHPLKIVVFDFASKGVKVLEQGYLYKAVAASCAVPGIFEPIRFKDDMLLDGGILNPLPTKVLLNYGANKIIAVNIIPSQEEMLNEYKKRGKLHIFDFIFGSIETMQRQFIEQAALVADVVVHPNFANLHWLEFGRVEDFIKRGEAATLEKLPEIKKIVSS